MKYFRNLVFDFLQIKKCYILAIFVIYTLLARPTFINVKLVLLTVIEVQLALLYPDIYICNLSNRIN